MPVRMGTAYVRPYRVSWTDRETGKRRTKRFHWPGPADTEVSWLRGLGHGDVLLEKLDERDCYIEKLMRRGISRERAELDADVFGSLRRPGADG